MKSWQYGENYPKVTQSEQRLLEKWCQQTCSTRDRHKPSNCKQYNIYIIETKQSPIKWTPVLSFI